MSLFFISSPIGSGKTRAIAELCSQPAYSRRNVLFTSPTISLLVQTGEEIRRAANGLSPTIIHSQQSADSPHGDDPAVERLKDALISSEQGAKVLQYVNEQCYSQWNPYHNYCYFWFSDGYDRLSLPISDFGYSDNLFCFNC